MVIYGGKSYKILNVLVTRIKKDWLYYKNIWINLFHIIDIYTKCIVDTGEMDIYEMNDFLYNIILKNLP